jgi:alginate O-acetyltransferase complex protein AlgI
MNFSSIIFLFLFLPLTLGIHALTGRRFRNLILFLISLIFYAWGTDFVLVLLAVIALNYVWGHLIHRSSERISALLLIAALISNLLVLFYFKFLLINEMGGRPFVHALADGIGLPLPTMMPIGISFYTFQSISYLIDIRNRQSQPCRSFVNFGLFIAFFAHITAGPISRFKDFEKQLFDREITSDLFAYGAKRFAQGLAKKVLIANVLTLVSADIWESDLSALGTGAAWWGILCFALQIYYDFSGYSDMAVGLGCLFGFRLPENFNHPYAADSMRGFWDRWHMSLSLWFRYYLFFPMSRFLLQHTGRERQLLIRVIVTFVTMVLIGIWHGPSWGYLIWGALHGLLLAIEVAASSVLAKLWKPLRHAYVLLFVMIAWVFFLFPDLAPALQYLQAMFSYKIGSTTLMEYLDHYEVLTVICAILFAVPISSYLAALGKPRLSEKAYNLAGSMLSFMFTLALLLGSVMQLASQTYQAFLYFRF